MPYFVYASWNIGSFPGTCLLTVLLEPMLSLRIQNCVVDEWISIVDRVDRRLQRLLLRAPPSADGREDATQADAAAAVELGRARHPCLLGTVPSACFMRSTPRTTGPTSRQHLL